MSEAIIARVKSKVDWDDNPEIKWVLNTVIINKNQAWTVPIGAKSNKFDVRIFGGGGAGWMNNGSFTLTPGTQISILIGAGGTLNINNTQFASNGGTTSFGAYISANGGTGGNYINGNGGNGSSGGGGRVSGGRGYQFGGGGGSVNMGASGPYSKYGTSGTNKGGIMGWYSNGGNYGGGGGGWESNGYGGDGCGGGGGYGSGGDISNYAAYGGGGWGGGMKSNKYSDSWSFVGGMGTAYGSYEDAENAAKSSINSKINNAKGADGVCIIQYYERG